MSVDPSPSSFPVPGVRANLFPKVPSSRPEMKAQNTMLGLAAVCMLYIEVAGLFPGMSLVRKTSIKETRTHSKTCDCPEDTQKLHLFIWDP